MKINLFNDDCLNILKTLPDNSIDLCLTDLPYGILSSKKEADYQNENRNFCDWDFELPYDEVLPQLKRVIKDTCPVALFAKAPFTFKLYEEMTKHGFKFLYNWIWKKSSCPNFASMKFRPGNNYEEVMIFSKGTKRVNYYPHAEFNGEVKTKCKFYNYETRTPISSEEIFDKYLIPYILNALSYDDLVNISKIVKINPFPSLIQVDDLPLKPLYGIFDKDVRIPCAGDSDEDFTGKRGVKITEILNEDISLSTGTNKTYSSNASVNRIKLQEILNEDDGIATHIHGGEVSQDNMSMPKLKLDQIFKEKYRGQFEIDLENKILYRTVKSYRNFPASIIDVKYGNSVNKKWKKHPTTKPVEVLEFLLNHYTEEGDTVLDFTMGSGSTGVASKNLNRNFIGIEISKTWYDVANQRINGE